MSHNLGTSDMIIFVAYTLLLLIVGLSASAPAPTSDVPPAPLRQRSAKDRVDNASLPSSRWRPGANLFRGLYPPIVLN